jgi:hypothetical protein
MTANRRRAADAVKREIIRNSRMIRGQSNVLIWHIVCDLVLVFFCAQNVIHSKLDSRP